MTQNLFIAIGNHDVFFCQCITQLAVPDEFACVWQPEAPAPNDATCRITDGRVTVKQSHIGFDSSSITVH